jgi:hypothetical protein
MVDGFANMVLRSDLWCKAGIGLCSVVARCNYCLLCAFM